MTRAERDHLRAEMAAWIEGGKVAPPPTEALQAAPARFSFTAGAHVVRMLGLSGSATHSCEGALRSWARAVRRAEAKAREATAP
jgi:hypothetical protein